MKRVSETVLIVVLFVAAMANLGCALLDLVRDHERACKLESQRQLSTPPLQPEAE